VAKASDGYDYRSPLHMAVPDGIRALAILLVVLNHLFVFGQPTIGHLETAVSN
jgi:peptidoglycan/LPS O-acetylase OafA/YrhL